MNRLTAAIAAGLAAAAFGCAFAGPASAQQIFSSTSPWNTPVPENPTLEPNSADRIADLADKVATRCALAETYPSAGYNCPGINWASSSTTVYRVTSSTKKPLVLPQTNDYNRHLQSLINANGGIPFPTNAEPAEGTDAQITVLDTTNRRLYEFYRASTPQQNWLLCLNNLPWGERCHRDGKWHAAWGGIIRNYETDPGYFSNSAWPGMLPGHGWRWGATATSLPVMGGLITIAELQAGVVNHALEAVAPEACELEYMFPAQRTDGDRLEASCLPEGARLQLDPSVDVDAVMSHPFGKLVARAAQTYGIIVHDTHVNSDKGNFVVEAEDPASTGSNAYESGPGIGGAPGTTGFIGGVPRKDLLKGFPWHKLRVIESTHCFEPSTGPCLP